MKKNLLLLLAVMMFSFCANAQYTALLYEDFEGNTFPPEGWISLSGEAEDDQIVHAKASAYYNLYAHSGDHLAAFFYTQGESDRYLITPQLVPQEGDSIIFYLSVEYNYFFDDPNQTFSVEVSTTTNDVSAFTTILHTFSESDFEDASWYRFAFDLSDYVGQEIYIAFHDYSSGDGTGYFIDDVSGVHYLTYSCVAPNMLSTLDITTTEATFTWNSITNTNNLYYKTSDANEYEVIEDAQLTESGFTIEDLIPGTTYSWYVEAVCEDGSTTTSSVNTFNTLCGIISASQLPKIYDFENITSGTMPNCWTIISGINNLYPGGSTSYPHSGSYNVNFYGNNTTNLAALPPFDEDIHELRVNFWLRPYSSTAYGAFEVGVMSDIADPSTFEVVRTITASDFASSTYTNFVVPFNNTNLEGNGNFIAFRVQQTSNADWLIDDLTVEYIPACAEPSNVAISNITTNSATVTWTRGADDQSEFTVHYAAANSAEWQTIEVSVDNDEIPTTVLENLSANTKYNVFVTVNCAPNTPSQNVSFFTNCEVIQSSQLPFTYDFEDYSIYDFPLCWTRVQGYQTISGTAPYIYTSSINAHSGSKFMYFYPYATATNIVALPAIDEDIHELRVNFWLKPGNNSSIYGRMEVGLMSDLSDTSSFELVRTIVAADLENANYAQYNVSFNNTTLEGNENYIVFRCFVNTGYIWYLDDVTVEYSPECAEPSNLTVSNYTTTSATLTWQRSNSNQTEFTLYYKKASETEWESLDVSISGNEVSATIENLSASTIYQVRVEASCNPGAFSNVLTFSTACEVITVSNENPYTEDFTSNPICWSLGGWEYFSSFKCIGKSYTGSNYTIEALSPIFDISEVSIPYFKFNHRQQVFIGEGDNIYVYMRTSENGEWILCGSYDDNTNDNWTIDSLPIIGATDFLQIKLIGESFNNLGVYADDIQIYNNEYVSCIPAIMLASNNATASTVSLSWVSVAENNIVYYREIGAENWQQESVSNENNTTLQNLEPLTTYEWFVAAVCDNGNEQASAIATFTTNCQKISVSSEAWSENFESYSLGEVPLCWTQMETYNFAPLNVVVPSANVEQQYTHSLAVWASTTTPSVSIALPEFSEDLNTLRIKFGAKVANPASAPLEVGYLPSTSSNMSEFQTIATLAAADYSQNWNEPMYDPFIVNLDTVLDNNTSGVIVIRVQGTSGTTFSQWHIDNLTVALTSSCIEPTTLSSNNVTTNSADLTWNNVAESYSVFYKTADEETFTEIQNVVLTNGVYTLGNLTDNTVYEWYVVSHCSATEISAPSDIRQFTTECSVVTIFPYHESFESGSLSCWKSEIVSGSYDWSTSLAINNHPASDGDYFAFFTYTVGASARLVSPVFDLTSVENPVLTYDAYVNVFQGLSDSLVVFYRTAPTTNWNYLMHIASPGSTTYDNYELTLPNPTSTYQIMFLGVGRNGNLIFLDNIYVKEGTPATECITPTNLAVSGQTQTTATVTWTPGGAETAWKLQYKLAAENGWINQEIIVNNTPSYIITGLTESTDYEVRVKAVCGIGNESSWTEVVSYTTSIEERLLSSIKLYPNPASDYVDVLVSDNDIKVSRLEVYDVYGKLLNNVEVVENPTRINVTTLSCGMYFVKVITENGVATKSFIRR